MLLVHGDGGSFLKYGMDSQEESLKAGMRPGDPEYGADDPSNYGPGAQWRLSLDYDF